MPSSEQDHKSICQRRGGDSIDLSFRYVRFAGPATPAGARHRRGGRRWTSASSKRCSRWPKKARSPPPPTGCTRCSRTCRSTSASSKPSSACSCIVRDRRGAVPTEFGVRVLDRARAIRSELDALRTRPVDAAGPRSRPRDARRRRHGEPVARAAARRRDRAASRPACRCASPKARRSASRSRSPSASSRSRSSPNRSPTPRLVVEHLRDEALVGLLPDVGSTSASPSRCRSPRSRRHALILPPAGNPLRDEVDDRGARRARRRCACRSKSKASA